MKPLKDLQEISRMLAASPDLPAPTGAASVVRPEVLNDRVEALVNMGMGLPLLSFLQSDGLYLKLFFSKISEEANIFVPTSRPKEFLEELRNKIVSLI